MTHSHHPPPTPTVSAACPAESGRNHRSWRSVGVRHSLLAVIILTAAACASAEPVMRDPRRLVIFSGERLAPTRERMEEIDIWLNEQMDSIEEDPSFWIIHGGQEGPTYLWETMEVTEHLDTAHIYYQDRPGLAGAYVLYAHLHLMVAQGRMDKWLPELEGDAPFEIEKAILSRVSDAWLYQRSIYDVRPYDLLEELMYSKENDYLDAYVLTARPDAFVDARRTWMAENPDARDAFVAWFRRTFERDPPGARGGTGER